MTSTINLSREFTVATHTHSIIEIRSKIHHYVHENPPQRLTVEFLLQPGRNSVQEALRSAPCTRLAQLVSGYLDSSEEASNLCLSLYIALDRTRLMYAPITHLLDTLSIQSRSSNSISQSQCDSACEILLKFDRHDNPFSTCITSTGTGSGISTSTSANNNSSNFKGLRGCFPEVKRQLDLRLVKARRQHRILRHATQGSGYCLIASTAGIMATGLLLATHALVTFMAAPVLLLGFRGTGDLLAGPRRRLRNAVAQLDAAARGAFVLSNDLDTVERLADRIHGSIESDKERVRYSLNQGRGQSQPIEHVLRFLAKHHLSFLRQLEDLEVHICVYFAAVNRSRLLLLHQIQSNSQHT